MAEEGDESAIRWLISYADFMMQLVCLFILLYMTSFIAKGAREEYLRAVGKGFLGEGEAGFPIHTPFKFPTWSELRAKKGWIPLAERHKFGKRIRIELHKEGGYRLFFDFAMFNEGDYRLYELAKSVLKFLIENFGAQIGKIDITGFTSRSKNDAVEGIEDLAFRKRMLASRRANEAMRFIIATAKEKRIKIEPKQIKIISLGESKPAFPREQDHLNMRVELRIIKRYFKKTK
jgi:flagellar motor protein MotB